MLNLLGGVSPLVFALETGAGGGGGAPSGDGAGSAATSGAAQREGAPSAAGSGAGAAPGAGASGGSAAAVDGGGAAAAAVAADGGDKAPAGGGTIAGGAGDAALPKVAAPPLSPGQFPEDWRQQFAGDDKSALKALERLASPKALWDSYKSLTAKLSSGELKAVKEPPGADAKPEEVAAWRKEQGLPETPEAYGKDLKLANGLVLTKDDMPFVESFAQLAHEANMPKSAFDRAVGWYFDTLDAQHTARAEADQAFYDQSLAEVRQEWGNETTANRRAIANLGEMFPGGLAPDGMGTALFEARLPDGRKVGDHPQMLRGLAAIARELFPASTVVPAGTANPGAFIGSRMGEIESMMGDPRSAYNYGPQKAALQQEYRDLVDAQIRMKGRAA